MSNIDTWKDFWQNYRNVEVEREDDLYFQVGKTVNKKPVSPELLQKMIANIRRDLDLQSDDFLFEFCCGNGLITYELKDEVRKVVALDFSEHLIATAKKYKSADNVRYFTGSALDPLNKFLDDGETPTKYLMNDSLGYFQEADLSIILHNIKSGNTPFKFLITGIPAEPRVLNFYNTPERLKIYEAFLSGEVTYDAMGKWWKPDVIESICRELGLDCVVKYQDEEISNYRMDVIIASK
jgi:hypothetical protein